MDIELLVTPGCPNQAVAREVVERAAHRAGLDREGLAIRVTVIRDADEALARGFVGSPTVLVDGVDPLADPDAVPGLACRLYQTANGPSGATDVDRLRDALLKSVRP